jgi:uncharacterized membrane protein YgdD (TMEM256/DUF423 family)
LNLPWIAIAAIMGGAAVILGAVGAHIVRGGDGDIRYHDLAVTYQMFHVAALFAVAYIARAGGLLPQIAGLLILLGVLLFSGSLYYLGWTGMPIGFNITPTGGMFLIFGWFVLAVSGYRHWKAQS